MRWKMWINKKDMTNIDATLTSRDVPTCHRLIYQQQPCIKSRCQIWYPELVKVEPGSTLPQGDYAVVAPVILASDKTNLSQFGGNKQAWPVYLTIGNISKSIQCQPSSCGSILIWYLPVTKLTCFSKGARANAQYRLFHQAMRTLLQPLVWLPTGIRSNFLMCTRNFDFVMGAYNIYAL